MKRLGYLVIGVIVLVLLGAGGVALYQLRSQPTQLLEGDPWDYTLLPDKEMPAGWGIESQGVITPHDVVQESVETSLTLTASVSLLHMRNLYFAKYTPPDTSGFLNLTTEIIVYESAQDAAAALTPENPGAEWESVTVEPVGDAARGWHYINPADASGQNLYRIDFRYRNGIASLTLIGTDTVLPNPGEVMRYARLVLGKMQAKPVPAELQKLQQAGLADLRTRMVNQDQLASLDAYLGGRWQYDNRLLPSWTPNSSFGADTQAGLEKLGRITGYQMFMVKAQTADEKKTAVSEGFFQQITAYPNAATAKQLLTMMTGLESAPELKPTETVGDGVRVWGGIVTTTAADGTSTVTAVHEVTFQAGAYVASVRLQSRTLSDAEKDSVRQANLQFAYQLAHALAANLK